VRHAVILAGGSGTRLWPASRRSRPKQLIPLPPRGETLLEATLRRAAQITTGTIIVVTAEALIEPTREIVQRAGVADRAQLLAEPVGKNTAAAIALAAATLEVRDPDAVLAVLPADHRIADEAGFETVIDTALAEVERGDAIGTIGIVPARAETGFGYLEVASTQLGTVTPIRRFVEKPDRPTAEAYVASGTYLWNAGMFLASARRILRELEVHLEVTARAARAIAAGSVAAHVVYPTLPAISFDHAVMERVTSAFTIPAEIGWDDVGSWDALAGGAAGDNTTVTTTPDAPAPIVVDGAGNHIVSDDATLIVALGVDDLVIVKSGDAILVTRKAAAQDVRKVIEEIERRGLAHYL
jgi:mannose-1-phosphate guanylyltransferase